jgi:chromosomal replication initiator protein
LHAIAIVSSLNSATPPPGESPTIRAIQDVIAARFDVSRTDLLSDRRAARLVRARHVAIWLCRRLTTHSLPAIGRQFGDRDHTSVMHALRRIDALMAADPLFDAEMRALLFGLTPAGVRA